jgi:hypothetical protein
LDIYFFQLAWHPTKERLLAYGTSEGRVGIYDVSPGKQPILFRPFHHRSVYTLCWGPSVYDIGMCMYIQSVLERRGQILGGFFQWFWANIIVNVQSFKNYRVMVFWCSPVWESSCSVYFLTAGAAVSDGIFLYSCGDGEVVQYDPGKPDEGELFRSVNM